MTSFRRLSVACTIATFFLVAVGGLVRATRSGLGCGTDWPDCRGRLIPALQTRAELIEFSHRLVASIVGLLIAWLAFTAIRHLRHDRPTLWSSVAALLLVVAQALLGAAVVAFELRANLVAVHLATALSVLGVLLFITVRAFVSDATHPQRDLSTSRRSRWAAAVVLALMLVGSYLGGKGGRLDPTDWPLLGGALIPDLSSEVLALHFLHRILAVVAGVAVAVAASAAVRSEITLSARLARVAMVLFSTQILVGALNVWTQLNEVVVALHLALASALWATLVVMALLTHPQVTRPPGAAHLRTRRVEASA